MTEKERAHLLLAKADKNPLAPPVLTESHKIKNNPGRPRKGDTVKFGSQPKSIIIREILKQKVFSEDALTTDQPLDLTKNTREVIILENDDTVNKTIEPKKCIDIPEVAGRYSERKKKDQLFTCDYTGCLYSCKLSCNLIKHKRTHISEKPYLCDQCTFRSKFSNSLKVHKRLHAKEKPFKCKQCSYQCNSSSNLKKHCSHRHSKVNE